MLGPSFTALVLLSPLAVALPAVIERLPSEGKPTRIVPSRSTAVIASSSTSASLRRPSVLPPTKPTVQLIGLCDEPLCGASATYWDTLPWSQVSTWLDAVVADNPSWRDSAATGSNTLLGNYWTWYTRNASATGAGQINNMISCQVDMPTSCSIPWEALNRGRRDSILGNRVLLNMQRAHRFLSNDYDMLTNGGQNFMIYSADALFNTFQTGLYQENDSIEVKNFGASLSKTLGGLSANSQKIVRTAKDMGLKAAESWLVPLKTVETVAGYLSKLNIGLSVVSALLNVLAPPPIPTPSLVPNAGLKQAVGDWLQGAQTSFADRYTEIFGKDPNAQGGLLATLRDGKWDLPFDLTPGGNPMAPAFKAIVAARYFNLMAAKQNRSRRSNDYCTVDSNVFCWDGDASFNERSNVRVVQTRKLSNSGIEVAFSNAWKFDEAFKAALGDYKINLRQAFLNSLKCQREIEKRDRRLVPWNNLMLFNEQKSLQDFTYRAFSDSGMTGAMNFMLRDDLDKLFASNSAYPPPDFTAWDPSTQSVMDIPCLFSIPVVETPDMLKNNDAWYPSSSDGMFLRYASSVIRSVVSKDYGTATDSQGWSTSGDKYDKQKARPLSKSDIDLICSSLSEGRGSYNSLDNVMFVPCAMSCKATFRGGSIDAYDSKTDLYSSGCWSKPYGFPDIHKYFSQACTKGGQDNGFSCT